MSEVIVFELFEHLPDKGGENDFEAAVKALDRHFYPQLYPDYERFKLRQARQTDEESIYAFYARLRKLASTCADINQNDEI